MADLIATRIQNGVYIDQLPSEPTLTREFGVAYLTLRHAMQVLRDRSLIVTRQGRGTFIVPQGDPPTS